MSLMLIALLITSLNIIYLLKVCKRLHTDEDRDKLHNIKNAIFVNKISVDGLVKKYGFRYTDDITSSPLT